MIALTNNLTLSSATSGNTRAKRTMSALGQKPTCVPQRSCPLYPRKQTCAVQSPMSALGQKRTFGLFDDFVGAGENRWGEEQIERSRGFEINYEFELAGLQHGQVCGICTFKDTGDEVASLTICLCQTCAVAHQRAGF